MSARMHCCTPVAPPPPADMHRQIRTALLRVQLQRAAREIRMRHAREARAALKAQARAQALASTTAAAPTTTQP